MGTADSTYDFYQNVYHGTVITSEEDYARHLVFAAASVDKATFGRLSREGVFASQDVPEAVRFAVCAAAEAHARAEQHNGCVVVSETVGKHSVTYAGASSVESEMHRAAMDFLSGTRWVYRGLYDDERYGSECDPG